MNKKGEKQVMTMQKILNTVFLISLLGLLNGCATGSKNSILPQDGPTMKEVYDGHFNGTSQHRKELGSPLNRVSNSATKDRHSTANNQTRESNFNSYTRHSYNEIQQIFPRLRNQTLVMYIFPHLSEGERLPIPGYSTAFPLFIHPEYALPGELEEGY